MIAKGIVITVITAIVAVGSAAAAADNEFLSSLRDHLTPTASNRIRGEFVSWFDPAGPKSDNNYNFFANRLRFGATLTFPQIEVVVEAQDTAMVNLPGGATCRRVRRAPRTAIAPSFATATRATSPSRRSARTWST